jgi:hypothetical protein
VRDARGIRLALEAVFLAVVAAVLAVAEVRPAWIVLVMLLAWVVVALLEWAAWRDEPHWASGSPPRYYVPPQAVPPRPPGQELPAFTSYPRPAPRVSEAPTWIAPPELREQVLGWPAPAAEAVAEEQEQEPEPEESGWPVSHEPEPVGDRWAAEELPAEPEPPESQTGELEVEEPQPAGPAVEPVEVVDVEVAEVEVLEVEAAAVEVVDAAAVEVVEVEAADVRLARHRIDPFEDTLVGRLPFLLARARRRADERSPAAALPVLPRHAEPAGRDAADPDGE